MEDKLILVVDDQPELLEMIRHILERAGFTQVVTARSAKEALALFRQKPPALAVLDVMMPEMDGFALLREIRRVSELPVLLLTAKGEPEDKFEGFSAGADDYLVKPFLPKELVYRIRAILKRVYPENRLVELQCATVDLDRAEVLRDGERIPLTAKEYSILLKLYENAGRIVTVGALCQTVCGEYWQGYENTLMTHIRHLREKIEARPSAPVSLVTAKGLGYQLLLKEKTP